MFRCFKTALSLPGPHASGKEPPMAVNHVYPFFNCGLYIISNGEPMSEIYRYGLYGLC